MNASTLNRAYEILGERTPMLADCGLLCGAACCTSAYEDGEEMGIFLLPGDRKSLV